MTDRDEKRFRRFERLYEIVSWGLAVGLIVIAVTQRTLTAEQRPYLVLIALLIGFTSLVMARFLPLESEGWITYEREDKVVVESLLLIILLAAYLFMMIVPVSGLIFLFLPPILIEALVLHERVILTEAAFATVAIMFLELADVTGPVFERAFIIEFAVFVAVVWLMAFLTRRLRLLIEENDRLSRHLSQRLDQIQVVDQIVRQAEFFPQFDRLIGRMAEIITDAFDAERCGFFIAGSGTEDLRLHPSSAGFLRQERESFAIEDNLRVIHRVREEERPLMANSGDDAGIVKDLVAMKHLKNVMLVPLRVREISIGVLLVANKRNGDFSSEDLHFLVLLAGFISTLIDSSQTFARSAQERKTAERVTRLLVGRELRMKELKSALKENGVSS